jgi:hypothetical protein
MRTVVNSISKNILRITPAGIVLSAFATISMIAVFPHHAIAQTGLGLNITPPLYQISIAPGTEWKSTLKIVNLNPYGIRIDATVVDFAPDGETGLPVFENLTGSSATRGDPSRMSGWVTVPSNAINVPANQSYDIPLTISVPENADPGGHYAAILVGTLPPEDVGSGAAVGAKLASLIFARVPGDVIESGVIREFITEEAFVETPEQVFTLRFENKGNVHLVPQGEIIIRNMWGKERGKIIVNEKSSFGNVFPRSTRKFQFSWKSEPSIFDIGRYTAEAVLTYGELGKQSAVSSTVFWVIPVLPFLGMFGGTIAFFWFMSWAIRRYVRRALELERERLGIPAASLRKDRDEDERWNQKEEDEITFDILKRPLVRGAADLRKKNRASIGASVESVSINEPHSSSWINEYRLFIVFVVVLVLATIAVGLYFVEVFESERTFKVEEIQGGGSR